MCDQTTAFDHGHDREGKYFRGYSAIWSAVGIDVALVCPDMETLRLAWKSLSLDIDIEDLDESAVERVRIYKDLYGEKKAEEN